MANHGEGSQGIELFGGFPSLVFEPAETRDMHGHGMQISKRLHPGIALADVAIKQLLVDGHALNLPDFEAIYEQNGAKPATARTNLITDIRLRRFPTRLGMAIREVEVPKAYFYLDARYTYEDSDLATRIG